MLSVYEAETRIQAQIQPFSPENDQEPVPLLQARGRILATPVQSGLDFPHWDNASMDGYAVRHEDLATVPVTLTIVEEIPAGYQPQQAVAAGQAARILTGSMMPAGADTVVMQERTERSGDRVMILQAPEAQANVRHRGAFARAGESLLAAGLVLNAPEIAVLAAAQCVQVPVFRRPRVAILSTGSELVAPDQPLAPGQIVDSNQYALAALVAQSGGEALPLGIVPDQPEALRAAMAGAIAQADVVISSGGVSVGDYDYIDGLLAELGGTIHVQSVAIKPGKPLTVATFERSGQRSVLYFGLPGNPVSSLMSFWRFVQPAIRRLGGQAQGWEPVFVTGRSRQDLRGGGQRETYLWGRLTLVGGAYEFELAGGGHSSGNLINLAATNALAVVPVGQTLVPAGEPTRILQVGAVFPG